MVERSKSPNAWERLLGVVVSSLATSSSSEAGSIHPLPYDLAGFLVAFPNP